MNQYIGAFDISEYKELSQLIKSICMNWHQFYGNLGLDPLNTGNSMI